LTLQSRPFIEFLQSQHLGWTAASNDSDFEEKTLSEGSDGTKTRLLRLKAGGLVALNPSFSHEIFVLDGLITNGANQLNRHMYAHLPEGGELKALATALVLVFTDIPIKNSEQIIMINTIAQPWDRSGLEGEIAHLNYARKNLRFAPDGSRRTYLLGGMPHGYPSGGAKLERHPHAEEMFLISGDMPCSRGVMTAGAYFYRPPGIWHGLDATLGGFLVIMRTPGSNVTISEWSDTIHPVEWEPAYDPALPEGHTSFTAPLPHLVPDY
jgi:hypothetical protein